MEWNWQHPDWPNFQWDARELARSEAVFLEEAGVIVGSAKHLREADREALTVETMTSDAVDTSRIEGEYLDRESVQSSIRHRLGLATNRRVVAPAEAGIAEMMVNVFQTFSKPLSHDVLFGWHGMVAGSRMDLTEVGQYRTHAEPMRIVSGSGMKAKVHFEAPASKRVPDEMDRFIDWFNRGMAGDGSALPVLARAGIAHLWFESIHPFEDGNGRIGRAVAEKALMQGISNPAATSLSSTLLIHRKEYYHALELASRTLEITDWLLWFSSAAIEAGRRTLAQAEFLIHKAKLLDALKDAINSRQEKALLRMLDSGIDGFKGGLSARNYATITGAAPATVTRDLADLVAKGALRREGERKASRYYLNFPAFRASFPYGAGQASTFPDFRLPNPQG